MHKLITFGAASALLALSNLPADATVNKTWVSSTGTDSGTCQLVAPCKTFQFAHDQTSPGGEIDVKDSGSYGPIAISKSISIVAEGVLASIGGASNTTAVSVNIGGGDVVLLHGLNIDGHFAGGNDGLATGTSGKLVIDHCIIQNFSGFGLHISSSGEVTNNLISGNSVGIYNATGNIVIGGNVISANSEGIFVEGGQVFSYGDNDVNNNSIDVTGSLITAGKY